MKLITHSHLVSLFRIYGSVPSFPHIAWYGACVRIGWLCCLVGIPRVLSWSLFSFIIQKTGAFKPINKHTLPVYYCSNPKAWMTQALFEDWFMNWFISQACEYCAERGIRFKMLLVMDNALATPVIWRTIMMLEWFWCENVFKIVPVQVPTKLEMWQTYVAFVFVITYVLQAMWPCVVPTLIIDHRPLLSTWVSRVCALTSSKRGGWGKWGLNLCSGRAKNLS
jgi:hypothetical protein